MADLALAKIVKDAKPATPKEKGMGYQAEHPLLYVRKDGDNYVACIVNDDGEREEMKTAADYADIVKYAEKGKYRIVNQFARQRVERKGMARLKQAMEDIAAIAISPEVGEKKCGKKEKK